MTGANVSPGPGDPDGTGSAVLQLNRVEQRICFALNWSGIDLPFASHIHVAPVGEQGPVVVNLLDDSSSGSGSAWGPNGCVQGVDPGLIRAISKHPSKYYVDLHNTLYPLGAVRGQLHK
jgi:CHRD domain